MSKQPPLPTPRKPRDFGVVREVAETFERSDATSIGRLVDQSNGRSSAATSRGSSVAAMETANIAMTGPSGAAAIEQPGNASSERQGVRATDRRDVSSTGRSNGTSTGHAGDGAPGGSINKEIDGSGVRTPGKTIIERRGRLTLNGRKGARGEIRKLAVEVSLAYGARLDQEKLDRGMTFGDIVEEMMRATGRAPQGQNKKP